MTKSQPHAFPTSLAGAGVLHQWAAYRRAVSAFVRDCVWIYDATAEDWVRFELWPAQAETLQPTVASRKLVILKLGISWHLFGYAL